ncbi:hypothetical protein ACTNCE_14880 [Dorea longicatena]|uniref:hypothetical protein n=1 Tax=Dorea longicatena TaxID=88431 RepID=UPI002A877DB6|nr:hypothetical protein [Peptostreptococcus porci]
MAKKRQKDKIIINSENEELKDMINFANYIFEQVKIQQEARDKWMEIYLLIVGGVATFATFTLAFFTDIIELKDWYLILGSIFMLTGILGIFFYLLFLSQRINYKLHYKVLSEIQRIVIREYLSKPYEEYYPTDRSPFKKFKRGADFYASVIQNIVILVCFVVSCLFFLLYLDLPKKSIIVVCFLCASALELMLRFLYNIYEKKI